jgi:hypothetical protein
MATLPNSNDSLCGRVEMVAFRTDPLSNHQSAECLRAVDSRQGCGAFFAAEARQLKCSLIAHGCSPEG